LPNNGYFPYDTLEAKTALPDRWTPSALPSASAADPSGPKKGPKAAPESRLLVPHSEATVDLNKKIDLDTALQYGTAQGYPPLYGFIKAFVTQHLHPTIPYTGGADVLLTCGSTDGFSKTIECFINPWSAERGDPVELKEGLLVEEFAYMNAVQTAQPRGVNIVPVALDKKGMVAEGPGGLREVLQGWDFARGKRPHLMYTVTYVFLL
jgi:DNA-binding transcriptional MocR family regulator